MKNFWRNDSGAFATMAAILLPVFVAAGVLASEVGNWALRHQQMQGATDAAALAGVVAGLSGSALTIQGKAMAATSGFVDGVDGVTVQINKPPSTGAYSTRADAVETIIQRSYAPVLAKFISANAVTVRARSVAAPNDNGACILSLNHTAPQAMYLQGSSTVTLNGCNAASNSSSATAISASGSSSLTVAAATAVGGISGTDHITASGGIRSGQNTLPDPYASASYPAFSTNAVQTFPIAGTIAPGVSQGPIQGAVNMLPGIYYVDAGTFGINGSGSLYGTGVTIVLSDITKSLKNNPPPIINGNSPISLTAPTTGPTAGIVLFGDRTMRTALQINGTSDQSWGGAIYMPSVDLTFVGGASGVAGCTQIIADKVTFNGNANLSLNCAGTGVQNISLQIAKLVE